MRDCNQGRFRQQIRFLRRQFLQDGDLPFTDVLSQEIVAQALTAIDVVWKDRIYTPLVTLWVFLGQVLSADHSCRAAVARLIAHRLSQGRSPCSAETGAYCQARKRLPEKFFSAVTCLVGRALDAKVDAQWLWKGRRVYHVRRHDGHHARHSRKPASLSAKSTIRSRVWAFRSRESGPSLLVLWSDLESRRLPICWQGTRRSQLTPPTVGRSFVPEMFF